MASATVVKYPSQGASLPDATFLWQAYDGSIIDFSSGYTFVVKIAREPGDAAVITKTSGVVGFATSPNVQVSWADNELSVLTPGRWVMEITATDGSGKDRILTATLIIDHLAIT